MVQTALMATFLQERPMLVRLLVARLGNREDAEDAAQELWLKLSDLPVTPIANNAAYLYRMAANLASDRRTSATSGTARDRAWLEVQPRAQEQPDAERAMLARERLRQINETLDAMPERMSAAFRMFRIEEQSQKGIAARLGITVSGVEKLLQDAGTVAVSEVAVEAVGGWRRGVMSYANEPMSVVKSAIERRYRVELSYAGGLSKQRFTGMVRLTGDEGRDIPHLAALIGADAKQDGTRWILSAKDNAVR